MTSTTPAADALVVLLDEIASILEHLVKTLDQEYQLLKSSSAPELTDVVADKDASLTRLSELDCLRREFLNLQRGDQPLQTMEQLFDTLHAEQAALLKSRWDRVVKSTREVHRLNRRNGATIHLSRNLVETFIAIWRGQEQDLTASTYGPNAQPAPASITRAIAEV